MRGDPDDFGERHPFAPEIPLVIEISHLSLSRDQGWKKEIYARERIPVYWIVNLVEEQIEVYENVGLIDYLTKNTYQHGDEVPVKVDGEFIAVFSVSDLLP